MGVSFGVLSCLSGVGFFNGSVWIFDDKFSTEDGTTYGFWVVGEVTFFGAVYVSNVKLLAFSNTISKAQIAAVAFSILSVVGVWLWVSSFDLGVLEHTYRQVFKNIQLYVFLFIITGLCFIDWAVTKIVGKHSSIIDFTWFRTYLPPPTDEEFEEEVSSLPKDGSLPL